MRQSPIIKADGNMAVNARSFARTCISLVGKHPFTSSLALLIENGERQKPSPLL
jgi:hypothetical protein